MAIYFFVTAYDINRVIRNNEWTPFEAGYRIGDLYIDEIEQDTARLRPQLALTMIAGVAALLVGIILVVPKSKRNIGALSPF